MAAATVVAGTRRVSTIGAKRLVTLKVNIANNGDTYTDNALKLLQGVSIDSSASGSAVGATTSGGTITFSSGGAINNLLLTLIGL